MKFSIAPHQQQLLNCIHQGRSFASGSRHGLAVGHSGGTEACQVTPHTLMPLAHAMPRHHRGS